MLSVVQLVERWIVAPEAVSSRLTLQPKRVEIAECWQTTNAIVHSKSAICDSTFYAYLPRVDKETGLFLTATVLAICFFSLIGRISVFQTEGDGSNPSRSSKKKRNLFCGIAF